MTRALLGTLIIITTGAAGTAHADHGEATGDVHAHAYHPNHIAVFAGVATTADTSGASVGFDYERRFGEIGVAAIVDIARLHGAQQYIAAPAVVFHPWAGLKLVAAVGVEHGHGEQALLLRGGAGYDAHLGPISIGPSVSFDSVEGHHAVVAGLAVGSGF
jgi:hypothetical protein